MCSSAQTIGKGSVALRWQVCVRSRRDGGAGAAEIRCSVRTWTVPPGGLILIRGNQAAEIGVNRDPAGADARPIPAKPSGTCRPARRSQRCSVCLVADCLRRCQPCRSRPCRGYNRTAPSQRARGDEDHQSAQSPVSLAKPSAAATPASSSAWNASLRVSMPWRRRCGRVRTWDWRLLPTEANHRAGSADRMSED